MAQWNAPVRVTVRMRGPSVDDVSARVPRKRQGEELRDAQRRQPFGRLLHHVRYRLLCSVTRSCRVIELRRRTRRSDLKVVRRLVLDGRDHANPGVQAPVVPPADPRPLVAGSTALEILSEAFTNGPRRTHSTLDRTPVVARIRRPTACGFKAGGPDLSCLAGTVGQLEVSTPVDRVSLTCDESSPVRDQVGA